MPTTPLALPVALRRGVVAGLAGTVVMTAFQELVEMPLTGRGDSYAPADFAARVLRIRPRTQRGRTRVNWATHVALGASWGAAHGGAAARGLSGPRAVLTAFAAVYTADVLLNTALGLYAPSRWSRRDWAVDVTDKFVQAAATGVLFETVLRPRTR